MTEYLFPEYDAGDELTADDLTLNTNKVTRDTYTPILNATGGTPALGASGFLTGKWQRFGRWVIATVDLNFLGAGVSIVGSSYRISLPFDADLTHHTAGPLDAASDIIGGFGTRSGTASQALHGSALLAGPNGTDTAGTYMIFYAHASNSSIGSTNFTTSGRLKARVAYLATAASFP